MHVSVESTGNLSRRMTVAVPAARFEQEFSTRLKRIGRNAKLPGFRPGKVPMKMLEAQYGSKLMQEVASDLIQATFYEAAGKEGLRPAAGPTIEPKEIARGQDFEYTALFEVYPEIGDVKLPTNPIDRVVCRIGDDDVERTLETMRKQRMTWETVERPAAEGDRLEIDFVGTLAGVPFDGGEATGFMLTLGSNSLIEGFESGLVGARAGDKRTLNVTFPADYRNTKLAGQPVVFAVDVKQVQAGRPAELNAEFFTQLGMVDGTPEALRGEIRMSLQKEADNRTLATNKQHAFKALLAANPLDLPQGLVEQEARRLADMIRSNLSAQNVPTDKLPTDAAPFREQARERVALGLVLAEFVKRHNIKVTPADIRARIEEMATGYDSPAEFVKWHYARPERLGEVESLILEERAVEALLQAVPVTDKVVPFKDLSQTK